MSRIVYYDNGHREVGPQWPLPVTLPRETPLVTLPATVVGGIVTGAAYAADDVVGQLFDIPVSCDYGTLRAVTISCLDVQSAEYDILLFDHSVTVPTDNAAFALAADHDRVKLVAVVKILATDTVSLNSEVVGTKTVDIPFSVPNQMLYGVLTTQSSPNYSTADPIRLRFAIRQWA